MMLDVRPITLRDARRFIGMHHRHSMAPRGWLFGVQLVDGGSETRAVAVASRPVAQALQDGRTIEVTRVCTLGDHNAASRCYGALCRAAKALGYARAVTYTLADEPGTSPRAAGFTKAGEVAGGRSWRGRASSAYPENLLGEAATPVEGKVRWERML